MFRKGKTVQQKNLFDLDQSFSPVVKSAIENSWAGTFFENVFLAIREERFAVLYSSKQSRPNVPVNLLISLLTLKELNGLTDEELIETLLFDYRFHYALGISDIEKERICINTLTHFRKRLFEHEARTGQDLLREEIEYLSNHLADISQLDYSMARMDSMMISSNCKQLSRLELVFTVIRNMVREMDQQNIEIPELFRPYLLSTHKKTVLYRVRQDETLTRTDELFQQAIRLYEEVSSINSLLSTEAYSHLKRLLEEQTVETEEGVQIALTSKNLPSSRLRNPSDSDATYRKKGEVESTGYVSNLVEVRDVDKKLSFILHYDVKPNIYSDQAFGEDFVTHHPLSESIQSLVADGAYYRENTVYQSRKKDIFFHVTQMTGGKIDPNEMGTDKFICDPKGHQVVQCPGGHTPLNAIYKEEQGVHLVKFAKPDCQVCPLLNSCPVQEGKDTYRLRFTDKKRTADEMRAQIGSDKHRVLANFRAGVEGLPSVLRRRYRIDHMPIRGLVRSKMWIGFKILAYNIKRMIQHHTPTRFLFHVFPRIFQIRVSTLKIAPITI